MNEKQKFGEHELLLLYHPTITDLLRKNLDHLRFDDGDFTHVLKDPRAYTTLQAVIAYDNDGYPRGWAGIYNRPEDGIWRYDGCWAHGYPMPTPIIGVFVQDEYRHLGLGGALKSRAAEILKQRGIKYTWQDSHSRLWVEVDINGNERRYL